MDAKWESIRALDLGGVKARLASKKGWWWRARHDVGRLEKEYRQFLYLIATHPGQTVVPWSQALDDFWHEHILDTGKYARDCQAVLGGFIHHDPHLPKGTSRYATAFDATRRMYRSAFEQRVERRHSDPGDAAGCGAGMPVVFCGSDTAHASHAADHSCGGPHDSGAHHGSAGHDGGAHGCGGHGAASHGCGGHGCGGHGCGGGH